MKFTLRDLCWLMVVVGLAAGWYAHANSRPIVRVGDLTSVVGVIKNDSVEDCFLARGIVHTVTKGEIRFDHSVPTGMNGVVIHESGAFLGVTFSDKAGTGKVRRVILPK